ncbi:MAG: hypothetical protein LBK96_00405 [Prevotellaceae bacterium]|nr:hypothetical protein [Prevotellaceae bacterium]
MDCCVKVRFFVLGLITLIGGNMLSAQDIIVPKSGEETEIKVRKVSAGSAEHKKNIASFRLIQFDIPDFMKSKAKTYPATDMDTTSRELRYSHNFQSGIPAMDNYLDIKILDGTGKKMKKDAIRFTLADTPEALNKYNSGTRLYTAAGILGIASLGILVVRLSGPEHKYFWMTAGIACGTGGFICRIVGTSKLKSAINLHNGAQVNRHASDLSLNFGVPQSGGLGLMLNF